MNVLVWGELSPGGTNAWDHNLSVSKQSQRQKKPTKLITYPKIQSWAVSERLLCIRWDAVKKKRWYCKNVQFDPDHFSQINIIYVIILRFGWVVMLWDIPASLFGPRTLFILREEKFALIFDWLLFFIIFFPQSPSLVLNIDKYQFLQGYSSALLLFKKVYI